MTNSIIIIKAYLQRKTLLIQTMKKVIVYSNKESNSFLNANKRIKFFTKFFLYTIVNCRFEDCIVYAIVKFAYQLRTIHAITYMNNTYNLSVYSLRFKLLSR